MSKDYTLWPRPRKKGKPIYYVQFRDAQGNRMTAKSTGKTSEAAARLWAEELLENGQLTKKEKVKFNSFATGFFTWEGEYIKKRLSRSRQKSIGKRHALNMAAHTTNYLIPYFGDAKLSSISENRIEKFQDWLVATYNLSPSTVNSITRSLMLILKEAHTQKILHAVPSPDCLRVVIRKPRGILTIEEVRSVLSIPWKDNTSRLVNRIGASTGMRLGEILGLQRQFVLIDKSLIIVKKTWEKDVGLKDTTKTGKSRAVSLPTTIARELKIHLESLLWKDSTDLVFPSKNRFTPITLHRPRLAFYNALEEIGITKDERKARGIVFHSWRHWLNSMLIHGKVPLPEIKQTTGHITNEMTEETYFHMIDFSNIQNVQNRLFDGDKDERN